ncbi:hypothetical protein L6E10_36340 [Lentzea sp. CC55]|nr:hypothetical protein [Lentzea sp. CC55]MCG8927870.1 hypothetical protein [Lentzea sp. CC55]
MDALGGVVGQDAVEVERDAQRGIVVVLERGLEDLAAGMSAGVAFRTSFSLADRNSDMFGVGMNSCGARPSVKIAWVIVRPWWAADLGMRRPVPGELRDSTMTSTSGPTALSRSSLRRNGNATPGANGSSRCASW